MSLDVIDRLAGVAPGSALSAIRDVRLQARDQAQASYRALFEPAETSEMSVVERFAVAAFVAGLHGDAGIAAFYAEGATGLADAITAETARGRTTGPYGAYPPGKLNAEDTVGPAFHACDAAFGGDAALGRRLGAALEHAHMLVFHPRDASGPHLQALLDVGWSTTGIVTLSQLVAFLAFQIRVVTGLRVLAATGGK